MAGRESAQRLLTTRLNVPEAEAALKMYMKRHEDLKGMCRPRSLIADHKFQPTCHVREGLVTVLDMQRPFMGLVVKMLSW
jgi:hypothetical protein